MLVLASGARIKTAPVDVLVEITIRVQHHGNLAGTNSSVWLLLLTVLSLASSPRRVQFSLCFLLSLSLSLS